MANKFCPNKSHPEVKALIKQLGLLGFYREYINNNYQIPSSINEDISDTTSVIDQIAVNKDLFSAHQQEEITKSLVYLIQLFRNDGLINVVQIKKAVAEEVEFALQDQLDLGGENNLALADKFKDVLDHFDKFYDQALRVLNSQGIKITINSIQENNETTDDSVYEDQDGSYQKLNYSDESNFQQSSKDTASSHIKTELSLIPKYLYENGQIVKELDEDGIEVYAEELNFLGLARYEDLDVIWNDMLYTLIDVPIGSKLEYLAKSSNPKHQVIAASIRSNPNIEIQNEFESVFSKQQANSATVLISRPDPNGNQSIKVIDTNRNNPTQMLSEDWYNNFLQSNIVKTNSLGDNYVDTALAKVLQTQFKEGVDLLTKDRDKGIGIISRALNKIGINLSLKALTNSNTIYVNGSSKNVDWILANKVKFIFDRLAGDLAGEVDIVENSLELNNPFIDENDSLDLLAKLENLVNPGLFESSYVSGDGKAKYSFVNNSYLSHKIRTLKTDTAYLENLKKTGYTSESYYLNQMLNPNSGETFRNTFNMYYVDTIGNDATNQINKTFNDMNTREKEFTRVAFFQNSGAGTDVKNKGNIGYFIGLIPSDKTTLPVFKTVKVNTNSLQNTIDVLYDQFVSEYNRIKNTIAENSDDSVIKIDKYHGENGLGSKFIVFPQFNDILFDENKQLLELDDARVNELVRPTLEAFISSLTEDTIAYWTELGLYNKDLLDKSYKAAKGINIKSIPTKQFNKLSKANQSEETTRLNREYAPHLRKLAMDYAVNYFVFHMNQTQLISGDPALHGKVVKDDGVLNLQNSVNASWVNFYKRMAKDIAPGLDGNFKNSTFNTIFLKDLDYVSDHLMEYREKINAEIADSYGYKKDKNGNDTNVGIINPADAQEYTTLAEHLEVLEAFGRLTNEQRAAGQRLLQGGVDINDVKLILQPMKPVYVESKIDGNINKLYYIKTSSFPLIPALTKGLEIDKLRVLMESNSIDRAVYESGVKLGIQGQILNVSNDGGIRFNELSIDPKQIINLPRSGFRIQQEIPYHGEDTTINEGTQADTLILNNLDNTEIIEYNGQKMTGREAKDIYETLHIEKMNRAFDNLLEEIGYDKQTNEITDLDKLAEILRTEARDRNYPINDIYSIQVIEENGRKRFKVPLGFNNSATKFESILTSLVTNRVIKSKLPGFSKIQGAGSGFQMSDDASGIYDFVKSGITWINPEDTKLNYVTEKNGKLVGADILVPNWFKDKNGNKINIKQYINPETGVLDTSKLPEELLTVIGLRIPTQGYNSMMKFTVKGFLPDIVGDLAIVPAEITIQMGSDFDVDKLFVYNYHYNIDKNGKLSKIKTELPDLSVEGNEIDYSKLKAKEIDNLIIQMFEDRLSDVRLFDQILEPNGFGALPDTAKEVAKTSNATVGPHTFTSREQNNIYEVNSAGKMGVAQFSLFSTFFKSAQDAQLHLEFPYQVKDSRGQIHQLNSLSSLTNIEGNKKSNVIMYLQSAAVDNSKEQILGHLNINSHTMGIAGTMAMLGYDERYIGYFLSQPSIREYVTRINNARDIITSSDYNPDIENSIINDIKNQLSGDFTPSELQALTSSIVYSADQLLEYLSTGKPSEFDLTTLSTEEQNKVNSINNLFQLKVFLDFVNLKGLSDEIRTLQSSINAKTKGLGSGLIALEAKTKQVNKTEFNTSTDNYSILNADKLFEYGSVANAINILRSSRNLYSTLAPYASNSYESVLNQIIEAVGMPISENNLKNIYNDIKSFILSSENFIGNENLEAARERLIFSEDNIAQRWLDYSNTPEGKRNILTKRIKPRLAVKNSRKPSYNRLESLNTPASNNKVDIENSIMYFYNMLNSSNPTERQLAEDVVKYFIITGAQYTPRSIGKYITYDALEKYGFSQKLREVDDKLFNEDNLAGFVDQYFQNNPFKAKNINLTEFPDTLSIQRDNNILLPDGNIAKYLLGYDTITNSPNLYKQITVDKLTGGIIYVKLPILGDKIFKRYNSDKGMGDYIPDVDRSVGESPTTNQLGIGNVPTHIKLRDNYGFDQGITAVLNRIIERSNIEEHIKIAQDILANNTYEDLNLISDDSKQVNGYFDGSNVAVNIDFIANTYPNYNNKFEEVFLHELLHGITVSTLNADESTLTKTQIIARNKINRLFNQYITSHPEKEALDKYISINNKRKQGTELSNEEWDYLRINKDKFYPLVNVREFVAAGLTNKGFRDTLKNNNIWQQLLEFISNLIGINKNDLDFLYNSTIELIQDNNINTTNQISEDITEFNAEEYERQKFVDQRNEFFRAYKISNYFKDIGKKYTGASQARFLQANANPKYDRLKIWFWNNELRISKVSVPTLFTNIDFDIEDAKPQSQQDKFIDRTISRFETTLANKIKYRTSLGDDVKPELDIQIEKLQARIEKLKKERSVIYTVDLIEKRLGEIDEGLNNNPNINQLKEYIEHLKEFVYINEQIDFDIDSELGAKYANKVNSIAGKAQSLIRLYRKKAIDVVEDMVKEKLDISYSIREELEQGIEDIGGLESGFLDFSQSSSKQIQTLGYLIERIKDQTVNRHNEFISDFATITKEYLDKYKNYDMLLQEGVNGRKTGHLLNKYSDAYYKKAKEDKKFARLNTTATISEENKARYEADRLIALETHSDADYLNWLQLNDPYAYMDAYNNGQKLRKNSLAKRYVTIKPDDIWIDPKYTALMALGENDPAVKFYNAIDPIIRRNSKRYGQQVNYIPELNKTTLDLMLEGNVKGGLNNVWENFGGELNDEVYSKNIDIDPITGEQRYSIPVYMFRNELTADEKSYDLARIVEATYHQEQAVKLKHEIEPLLNVYYALLKDTKSIVSKDEKGNPIAVDKEASRITEYARFMINDFLYSKGRSESDAEQKFGKATDRVISYVRIKGMGYNPFSAIGNVMQGLMSNYTFSLGNQFFNSGDFFKSMGQNLHTFAGNTDIAKKISKAFIMTDAFVMSNELNFGKSKQLQDASQGVARTALNPFILQQKGEYFVQGLTMVSVFNNEKVTNLKGETKSLWEAFDNNMNWKTDEFGENPYLDERKLFKLRMKVRKSIIDIHGNYARPIQNKKHFYVRAMMVFRTWLPQAINNRFGAEVTDEFLGTVSKGRLRSIPNLIRNADGKIDFEAAKQNLLWLLKLSSSTTLSEVDKINMRKNLGELILLAVVFATIMMLRAGLDDEEEEYMVYLTNNLLRMQADLTLFINPVAFDAILKDPIPLMGVTRDLIGVLDASAQTIMGEGIYKTGFRKDQSKLFKEVGDLVPFWTQIDKNIGYASNVFDN